MKKARPPDLELWAAPATADSQGVVKAGSHHHLLFAALRVRSLGCDLHEARDTQSAYPQSTPEDRATGYYLGLCKQHSGPCNGKTRRAAWTTGPSRLALRSNPITAQAEASVKSAWPIKPTVRPTEASQTWQAPSAPMLSARARSCTSRPGGQYRDTHPTSHGSRPLACHVPGRAGTILFFRAGVSRLWKKTIGPCQLDPSTLPSALDRRLLCTYSSSISRLYRRWPLGVRKGTSSPSFSIFLKVVGLTPRYSAACRRVIRNFFRSLASSIVFPSSQHHRCV